MPSWPLRALIIANAPADMRTWQAETLGLREALPEGGLQTLIGHEQAVTLHSAEYVQASQVYFKRHVCRLRPWPEEVVRIFPGDVALPRWKVCRSGLGISLS